MPTRRLRQAKRGAPPIEKLAGPYPCLPHKGHARGQAAGRQAHMPMPGQRQAHASFSIGRRSSWIDQRIQIGLTNEDYLMNGASFFFEWKSRDQLKVHDILNGQQWTQIIDALGAGS